MMRKMYMLTVFVLLAFVAGSQVGFANGLNLNGIGSRAMGMGGAFIGLADDYSAVFWNPAGLTQMTKPGIFLFETNLMPTATYSYSAAHVDATTVSRVYPAGAVGYFHPLGDRLIVGFSAYTPAGTGAEWNGQDLINLSGGVAYNWKSFMGMFTFAPVVAYRLTDMISIGATFNFNYGLLNIKKPAYGQYNEDLTGTAIGATFGVHVKPCSQLSFGAVFRTASTVTFTGTAEMAKLALLPAPIQYIAGGAIPATSEASRTATWPMWLGFGVAYKPLPGLTVTADMQFTNWKKVDTIPVTYTESTWTRLQTTTLPIPQIQALRAVIMTNNFVLNWEDKIQWRFGVEYQLNQTFALRAGYYYDPCPAPLDTLTILLPQFSYNAFSIGGSYTASNFKLEMALEYLAGLSQDSPATGKMPGTHGMKVFVPNIQFTYTF